MTLLSLWPYYNLMKLCTMSDTQLSSHVFGSDQKKENLCLFIACDTFNYNQPFKELVLEVFIKNNTEHINCGCFLSICSLKFFYIFLPSLNYSVLYLNCTIFTIFEYFAGCEKGLRVKTKELSWSIYKIKEPFTVARNLSKFIVHLESYNNILKNSSHGSKKDYVIFDNASL
ncbi:hypothetical protein BY458DRAFT_488046 [Sporodiniella umbellata]|nr:hypothetical protein BY458DRAFT_488046 [Sporodiniella umbellata]